MSVLTAQEEGHSGIQQLLLAVWDKVQVYWDNWRRRREQVQVEGTVAVAGEEGQVEGKEWGQAEMGPCPQTQVHLLTVGVVDRREPHPLHQQWDKEQSQASPQKNQQWDKQNILLLLHWDMEQGWLLAYHQQLHPRVAEALQACPQGLGALGGSLDWVEAVELLGGNRPQREVPEGSR